MAFFNVFSDPKLKARQDQLNAQWVAVFQTIESCGLTPSSGPAFQQFYADFESWKEFYEGGNDWSSASENATNSWQSKLQEHTANAKNFCSFGYDGSSSYVPGVKDPPADAQGILGKAADLAKAPFETFEKLGTYFGIGIGVLILIVAGILVYVIYRGIKADRSGVSVG
jgi:hypothetical protein